MLVSQKTQYALRAIFELARRRDDGWVKISQIARTQSIPQRFLEVILSQLKQGGFVTSKRGTEGGYMLVGPASNLTVGQVLEFLDGPVGPVEPTNNNGARMYGHYAFVAMWENIQDAISGIYDNTTFQHLMDEERRRTSKYIPSYSI